jgi:hypothetical protein
MEIFKKDQEIIVSMNGKQVDAVVTLASPNGVSLMIRFDDMLGGYIGMMPVFYSEEKQQFTDLIEGRELIIKSK